MAAVLLVVALGLRVGYVETTSYRAVNDAGTYNRFAATIAEHGDYETGDGPGTGAGGSRGPTAYFPPAYPYLLSVADLIDGQTAGHRAALEGERLEGAALGTLTVALTGLVALELFGATVGLVALGLAAVYPVMVTLSGALVAENLLVLLELAAVWTALRAGRATRPWRWLIATGILCGLATLAHENAALMLIPLAVAAARAAGGAEPARGRRTLAVGTLALATAAMIAPWTVRNAVELHHFVPVSDETGITLRGAYNPASAADRAIPFRWRLFWDVPADAPLRREAGHYREVELGARLERRALDYIGDHPSAPLSAGWHNLTRMFELEGATAWHASAAAIDLSRTDAQVGVISFWVLCLLALAGLCTPAVRRAPKWPWAIPVLFALSVVFVNVETPRFRAPIDPFVVLLAATGVTMLAGRVRSSPP